MEPGSTRWVEVTPSEHDHERAGLAAIRELLSESDPYRAWSNFTFTTKTNRQYEVDLLVIGRGGIYLLELKHWSGRITGDYQTWFHNRRPTDNPRLLADSKAKHFKQLLADAGGRNLPFVHAGVVLHNPQTTVQLDTRGRAGVYRIDGQGPAGLDELIKDVLAKAPQSTRDLIDGRRSAELARLINRAGVRKSIKYRQVGNLLVSEDPIAEGPGWQDHLADHPSLGEARRVRFYLVNQAATEEERAAILRAAKREYSVLENAAYPGIARAIEFYEHERGPAVVFKHDPTEVRLDHFLRQQADRLSMDQRIELVRTLAGTLRYAHARRLVHRRLSPLSVYVRTLAPNKYGARVRDWHTASRILPGQAGPTAGTRTLEALTDRAAHGYLAPETLHSSDSDAVAADVFGLGALTFLIFTGKSPAETSEDLLQRIARESGLDISAELPGASQTMVNLVREATLGDADLRTESVDQFAQAVEELISELREVTPKVDPLVASQGAILGTKDEPTRFEVLQRLGQGSTAVALLVKDSFHDEAVLKIALDEDAARQRLLDEAAVLPSARDARIARILTEPLEVGNRTAILLEDAGRESLAAMIRRGGRLSLDFLLRWGTDLLEILHSLELAGVTHRDIKPDNLAFRPLGKNDEVHLTLFDFSLAKAPLEQTKVGTPPYLDPFFHPRYRPQYDSAAERYAAAVTMYEMATGQTPIYGTGSSHPATVDADVTIDESVFEPGPARNGLISFFRTALARDVKSRHDSLESMRTAWQRIIAAVPAPEPLPGKGSVNPVTGEELDALAAEATLETTIAAAGLTARAVDALHRIDVRTVADLLARNAFELSRLSGIADLTKKEIRRRAKQWRARLQQDQPAVVDGDTRRSIDALLESLLPKRTKTAPQETTAELRILRLYLGLDPLDTPWASNAELGKAAGVSAGRVGQVVPDARKGWTRKLSQVRNELIALTEDSGGVNSAVLLAEALLTSRGSATTGAARRQRALGLVRAIVEVESERRGSARLLHRRVSGGAMIAVEDPTDPEAVEGIDLLDYAARLGKAADRLADADPLLSPAQVETALRAVRTAPGMAALPAEKLATLAASVSDRAAANSLGEIYPRRMEASRALKLLASSLGVIRHSVTAAQLKARILARYPAVGPLPESHDELDALLRLAKVPLVRTGALYQPQGSASTLLPPTSYQPGTRSPASSRNRNAADFERRMRVSLVECGFVTLNVDQAWYPQAIEALQKSFAIEVIDITAELLTAMHATAQTHGVDWTLVLRSDRPDAAPQDAANLRQLVALAAVKLEEKLRHAREPLLIVEAAPLARYDRLVVLEHLADQTSARPAARWLLLPANQVGRAHLDNHPAPGALSAIHLSTTWITAQQRAAS